MGGRDGLHIGGGDEVPCMVALLCRAADYMLMRSVKNRYGGAFAYHGQLGLAIHFT